MSDFRSHFMIVDFKDNIQSEVVDAWLQVWSDTMKKLGDKGIAARMRTHIGDMKGPVKSLKIEFNCYAEWDKPEVYGDMLGRFIAETGKVMPVEKISYSRGFPGAAPSYSVTHL